VSLISTNYFPEFPLFYKHETDLRTRRSTIVRTEEVLLNLKLIRAPIYRIITCLMNISSVFTILVKLKSVSTLSSQHFYRLLENSFRVIFSVKFITARLLEVHSL
jgi:hypothetical protein